ncbi:hypothetical protein SeMB42_g02144 [Synchytrium endobioticum]|uniref:DH domain-containing protein n=1 Tax=Synchytrium endobioticum TaxID=286115 RepID=A0A507DHK5_9FUNG|nr:hypothetical protein SeMB42_g02144 [Synchytrium endobioticum]
MLNQLIKVVKSASSLSLPERSSDSCPSLPAESVLPAANFLDKWRRASEDQDTRAFYGYLQALGSYLMSVTPTASETADYTVLVLTKFGIRCHFVKEGEWGKDKEGDAALLAGAHVLSVLAEDSVFKNSRSIESVDSRRQTQITSVTPEQSMVQVGDPKLVHQAAEFVKIQKANLPLVVDIIVESKKDEYASFLPFLTEHVSDCLPVEKKNDLFVKMGIGSAVTRTEQSNQVKSKTTTLDPVNRATDIRNLVSTEQSYGHTLDKLIKIRQSLIKRMEGGDGGAYAVNSVLPTLDGVYQVHKDFLCDLMQSHPLPSMLNVLDAFEKHVISQSDRFEVYTMALQLSSTRWDMLNKRDSPLSEEDARFIRSNAPSPAIRFTRYIISLRAMLENTPTGHDEFAAIQSVYTKIKRAADAINEKEREMQSRGIMLQFRDKFRPVTRNPSARDLSKIDELVKGTRQFVEAFNVVEDHAPNHDISLVLFNDAILFATISYKATTEKWDCEYGLFVKLADADILQYDNGRLGLVYRKRGRVTVKPFRVVEETLYHYAYGTIMNCILLQRHQITVTQVKEVAPIMTMKGSMNTAPETVSSKVANSLYLHRIGDELVYFNLMTVTEMTESSTQRSEVAFVVVSDQERLVELASVAAKFHYYALGVVQVSAHTPRRYRLYHTLGVFESGSLPNAAPIPKAAVNEEAFLTSFNQCVTHVGEYLKTIPIERHIWACALNEAQITYASAKMVPGRLLRRPSNTSTRSARPLSIAGSQPDSNVLRRFSTILRNQGRPVSVASVAVSVAQSQQTIASRESLMARATKMWDAGKWKPFSRSKGPPTYEVLDYLLKAIEAHGHLYQSGIYTQATDARAIQIMRGRGRLQSDHEIQYKANKLSKQIRQSADKFLQDPLAPESQWVLAATLSNYISKEQQLGGDKALLFSSGALGILRQHIASMPHGCDEFRLDIGRQALKALFSRGDPTQCGMTRSQRQCSLRFFSHLNHALTMNFKNGVTHEDIFNFFGSAIFGKLVETDRDDCQHMLQYFVDHPSTFGPVTRTQLDAEELNPPGDLSVRHSREPSETSFIDEEALEFARPSVVETLSASSSSSPEYRLAAIALGLPPLMPSSSPSHPSYGGISSTSLPSNDGTSSRHKNAKIPVSTRRSTTSSSITLLPPVHEESGQLNESSKNAPLVVSQASSLTVLSNP